MELLVDRPEVLGRLPVGVGLTVEVVERLGAVHLGLEQVVGLESEAAGELPEGGVALVNQLAAALHQLAVGEGAAQGPAAAADAVGGLVYGGRLAGPERDRGRGGGQPERAAQLERVAAGHPGLLGGDLGGRSLQGVGQGVRAIVAPISSFANLRARRTRNRRPSGRAGCRVA